MLPLRLVQALSIVLIIIMIGNFVMLIMQRITLLNFWILTGFVAVAAVWGIPYLKKQAKS